MDILTPKGQKTRQQEQAAIQSFLARYPDYSFIETPKDRPADIDGFVTKGASLICGVEVKCREMTLKDLMIKYHGTWLITNDKIDRGIALCRSCGIDFNGFLYLVPDSRLLLVPIWSYEKGLVCKMSVDLTETQATVNGGLATRLNAYIDVTAAKVIEAF